MPNRPRKKCFNCRHGRVVRPVDRFPYGVMCRLDERNDDPDFDPRDACYGVNNACGRWAAKDGKHRGPK
jgi:hypothetical protein